MKTTKRFDEAVTKLYNAFNEGTLNAFKCEHCAVGNLVGKGNWAMNMVSSISNTVINLMEDSYDLWNPPSHKDYSEEELCKVEHVFLTEWQKEHKLNATYGEDKQIQFKGLMAVIEYLAELDGIDVPQITVERFKEVLVSA